MNPTVRFLQPGRPPKSVELCSFDMTAHDVFAEGSGGGKVPEGHSLTVNGKVAGGSSVKPGDTVALQPNGGHG
jgi:hypothetical protein